jgi:hypothetical protein
MSSMKKKAMNPSASLENKDGAPNVINGIKLSSRNLS